tara:strand:- start:2888 stop:3205 length:318 start_codon:yes stop_codon:yes gene_type:complete
MTSVSTVSDQELAQFEWVESIATNSISDFNSSKSNSIETTIEKKKADLIDTFICHLIFYIIFCFSLFLYVVIDLGFGSFLKHKVTKLFRSQSKIMFPSFLETIPR